ncbi:hypothetical protein [Shewanella sp. TB7-MNA-CIBAN-0143]|uniref:hypothetical protein n=1 Tax=Shewanella sp. TB7-MNA-CIBAN-0143 TaxID=3140465 RepID=UPI0033192C10
MDKFTPTNKAIGGSAVGLFAYLLININATIAMQNEKLNGMIARIDSRVVALETTHKIERDFNYVQRPAK